jgi:hypothetical protein
MDNGMFGERMDRQVVAVATTVVVISGVVYAPGLVVRAPAFWNAANNILLSAATRGYLAANNPTFQAVLTKLAAPAGVALGVAGKNQGSVPVSSIPGYTVPILTGGGPDLNALAARISFWSTATRAALTALPSVDAFDSYFTSTLANPYGTQGTPEATPQLTPTDGNGSEGGRPTNGQSSSTTDADDPEEEKHAAWRPPADPMIAHWIEID